MKRTIPVILTLALGLVLSAVAAMGEDSSKVEQLRRSVEAIPENLDLRYEVAPIIETGV